MLSSYSDQDFYDAIRIGAIRRSHGNTDSSEPIEKRPVDHPRPDELAVGNDDIGAIGRAQHASPEANLTDFAENCSNLDGIPHLHGVFEYENETRHEVVHHVLQTKPDRKSTRLNSSHLVISYAVFCLKKKKKQH